MSEEVHQQAVRLELKKRFAEAAELWEGLGQVEKAIFNYHRAGLVKRAIDLALRKNLPRKAAELYMKAEIYDKAAELYRREKDYAAAARAYRLAGQVGEAAVMFETAAEPAEAARLYELLNDHLKAGELYEKAGDLDSAARACEAAIDVKSADTAGARKEMGRVAALLARVKNFEKAAEIYLQSQEVAEAVVLFVKMGEADAAARLLANCQGDVGFEVLSRIDYSDRTAVDFAKMFYLARDYGKAARVFEGCGNLPKAAYLFEKNQDYQSAAEAYTAAGDPGRGAEMFEKAQSYRDAGDLYVRVKDPGRAAACYEAAEDFFQAGRLYFEVERYDRAIDLLQKVGEADARYIDASALVAEILRRKGCLDLAVERYRRIVEGVPCDAASVEHYYNLAVVMLEKRDNVEAEKLLGEIARYKFGYRDAAQLLEEARRRQKQVPEPLPVPTLPPAAAAVLPVQAAEAGPSGAALGAARAPEAAKGAGFMVGRMEGFEVLAQTSLFEELSLAEMKRFWDVAELRTFEPGGTVLEEGRPGPGLFIVKRGRVSVMKSDEILVQLHAGEFFGEMSLMDESVLTSARIVAASEVEVFFLEREEFNRLLRANDHTALKMHRVFVTTLAGRLRRASEELAELRQLRGGASASR